MFSVPFSVPLTPPVDLIVQSNGAYQLMVKWKVQERIIVASGYTVFCSLQHYLVPSLAMLVILLLAADQLIGFDLSYRAFSHV